jgi:hypothetical protein
MERIQPDNQLTTYLPKLLRRLPIPEDAAIMSFRHLLEKHKLAPATLAIINGYLQEKGPRCARALSSMRRLFTRQVRLKAWKENAIYWSERLIHLSTDNDILRIQCQGLVMRMVRPTPLRFSTS